MDATEQLRSELERLIVIRTGRRIRDLAVEWFAETVILRGTAGTYYTKQLAQQGVREFLPNVRLHNNIHVQAAN